ncbi:MAG: zinc ribbon domain-containing protein [Candidatus Heimdallarchaeaceae archaeon]
MSSDPIEYNGTQKSSRKIFLIIIIFEGILILSAIVLFIVAVSLTAGGNFEHFDLSFRLSKIAGSIFAFATISSMIIMFTIGIKNISKHKRMIETTYSNSMRGNATYDKPYRTKMNKDFSSPYGSAENALDESFCDYCGCKIEKGQNYCSNCGKQV